MKSSRNKEQILEMEIEMLCNKKADLEQKIQSWKEFVLYNDDGTKNSAVAKTTIQAMIESEKTILDDTEKALKEKREELSKIIRERLDTTHNEKKER